MTSLWRNFSVNVVANNNWNCLLISAPKVHRRVQPPAARRNGRFKKMHGAVRALHVSLNNASTRTVHKCVKRNNGHLITLQIWMAWRYHIWGATHEAILKPSSEAPKSLWNKKSHWIWDNFPQIQLIKLSRILQIIWQQYVNGDGRHSKHFLYSKKCSHLRSLGCRLEQLRQFL